MDALIVIAVFLLITGGVIWAVRATAKPAEKKDEKPKEEYISPSDRAYMREYNLLNNAPPKQRTFVKREAPAPTVVVHNSGPDLLTTMILMDAMSSKHDTTSGSVTWKDETPTIHRSNTDNPIDFPTTPSYTSSYSSSSDDSSSRSSYSSSSSSDSSYSSSSSDSSYSSSSD